MEDTVDAFMGILSKLFDHQYIVIPIFPARFDQPFHTKQEVDLGFAVGLGWLRAQLRGRTLDYVKMINSFPLIKSADVIEGETRPHREFPTWSWASCHIGCTYLSPYVRFLENIRDDKGRLCYEPGKVSTTTSFFLQTSGGSCACASLADMISELHGNSNREYCRECGKEYIRGRSSIFKTATTCTITYMQQTSAQWPHTRKQ